MYEAKYAHDILLLPIVLGCSLTYCAHSNSYFSPSVRGYLSGQTAPLPSVPRPSCRPMAVQHLQHFRWDTVVHEQRERLCRKAPDHNKSNDVLPLPFRQI